MREPRSVCWSCLQLLDASDDVIAASPGSIALCMSCGLLCTLGPDLTTSAPDDETLASLEHCGPDVLARLGRLVIERTRSALLPTLLRDLRGDQGH